MGIMVQNNEKRSELSDRITADLREKGRRNSLATDDNVDFDIDDSEYKSKETHRTGRFAWIKMRPMSLAESGESCGAVSLGALFDGADGVAATSKVSVPDYAHIICRGGWPEAVLAKNPRVAYQKSINYVEAVINEDVHRVDGVERNPALVRLVLRSLARNITTLTATQTILDDVKNHMPTTSVKTLDSYLNALRRIFVVEDEPAWLPSVRSKTAIRTSHKRQLVDPSIATAVLGVRPERLMKDLNLFGFLFVKSILGQLMIENSF